MQKKRILAGIAAFLCLIVACAPMASALSLAVYRLDTLEEYEAELAEYDLPGDYVTYDMVKMVGSFDSLYLGTRPRIGGNFQYIHMIFVDETGFTITLLMERKSAREYARELEEDPVYDSVGNPKDLRTAEKDENFWVYSLGKLSYRYGFGELRGISWWHNGREYILVLQTSSEQKFHTYPKDTENTFLDRLLNAYTAEAALDELLASVKAGQRELMWNQFWKALPWAVAGGAAVAGMIFFVRWRKKRELQEEVEAEETAAE